MKPTKAWAIVDKKDKPKWVSLEMEALPPLVLVGGSKIIRVEIREVKRKK